MHLIEVGRRRQSLASRRSAFNPTGWQVAARRFRTEPGAVEEILNPVNQIGQFIHNGKSFESCLLLLDLSRFLKL